MRKRISIVVSILMVLLCSTVADAQVVTFDNLRPDSSEQITLELPVIDFPFHNDASRTAGGFFQGYLNQSMDMSMALVYDAQTAAHYGLRTLCKNKWYSALAIGGYDILSMWLPFGPGWLHEEYHRAVMTSCGVNSFDEIWLMHIFSSATSVSRETDEALALMHDQHRNYFIRLNSAGLEGLTHIVQNNQYHDFFEHRELFNFPMYWVNILNNFGYLRSCVNPATDADVDKMNAAEVKVRDRDFTGYDLSAWAYELFHPDVLYADRGIHPSGVGINRYIKYDQIGEEGIAYLKRQSWLELVNLASPFAFCIQRFYLGSTKSGDWYGNFSFRHYLTSFGDDLSLDIMLETPVANFVVTPHVYTNWGKSFPGLGVKLVDFAMAGNRLHLNADAQFWQQPEHFRDTRGKFGGCISADLAYRHKWFSAYVKGGWKSNGWMVGEVYLDSTWFLRSGFRFHLKQNDKS